MLEGNPAHKNGGGWDFVSKIGKWKKRELSATWTVWEGEGKSGSLSIERTRQWLGPRKMYYLKDLSVSLIVGFVLAYSISGMCQPFCLIILSGFVIFHLLPFLYLFVTITPYSVMPFFSHRTNDNASLIPLSCFFSFSIRCCYRTFSIGHKCLRAGQCLAQLANQLCTLVRHGPTKMVERLINLIGPGVQLWCKHRCASNGVPGQRRRNKENHLYTYVVVGSWALVRRFRSDNWLPGLGWYQIRTSTACVEWYSEVAACFSNITKKGNIERHEV